MVPYFFLGPDFEWMSVSNFYLFILYFYWFFYDHIKGALIFLLYLLENKTNREFHESYKIPKSTVSKIIRLVYHYASDFGNTMQHRNLDQLKTIKAHFNKGLFKLVTYIFKQITNCLFSKTMASLDWWDPSVVRWNPRPLDCEQN